MSRAFVKEPDGDDGGDALPERPVSPHPNFVTPEGLAAIDAEIAALNAALPDIAGDRARLAAVQRDLRYWRARRMTAEVVPPPGNSDEVRFGATVTIARDDGREQTWRIVSEDEADPGQGTIAHVSPLARALAGKRVAMSSPSPARTPRSSPSHRPFCQNGDSARSVVPGALGPTWRRADAAALPEISLTK